MSAIPLRFLVGVVYRSYNIVAVHVSYVDDLQSRVRVEE